MSELISVIETKAYLTNAERLLSEEDRSAVIDVVARDPEAVSSSPVPAACASSG